MKYLVTCTIFSVHILKVYKLQVSLVLRLNTVTFQGVDNLFFRESVQYMSVQFQDFIVDVFF